MCWSVADQRTGYLSRIIVFTADGDGSSKTPWESPLDSSYSPQIHFVEEIRSQGLPLGLIQRQTGAASSELDAIGMVKGRFSVLFHADGFRCDVTHLDDSKRPFIVVHSDASILDVPAIYRWTGSGFADDCASHAAYYKKLLADDRQKLPAETSAPVLFSLSRVAVLAGDRAVAKSILEKALARERSKGREANPETLQRITCMFRSLRGITH